MSKMMVNIKNKDVGTFKDNDILLYDEKKKEFYKTTAETFFREYEEKLNILLNKYDSQVDFLRKENSLLKKEVEDFKRDLTKQTDEKISSLAKENEDFKCELLARTRSITTKTIAMVEDFIKSGGKK